MTAPTISQQGRKKAWGSTVKKDDGKHRTSPNKNVKFKEILKKDGVELSAQTRLMPEGNQYVGPILRTQVAAGKTHSRNGGMGGSLFNNMEESQDMILTLPREQEEIGKDLEKCVNKNFSGKRRQDSKGTQVCRRDPGVLGKEPSCFVEAGGRFPKGQPPLAVRTQLEPRTNR